MYKYKFHVRDTFKLYYSYLLAIFKQILQPECVTEVWGLISLAYPSFSTDCFFGEKSESKTNFNHQGKYI